MKADWHRGNRRKFPSGHRRRNRKISPAASSPSTPHTRTTDTLFPSVVVYTKDFAFTPVCKPLPRSWLVGPPSPADPNNHYLSHNTDSDFALGSPTPLLSSSTLLHESCLFDLTLTAWERLSTREAFHSTPSRVSSWVGVPPLCAVLLS